MKIYDIKRLEKVVKNYKEIEVLLSLVYDSTEFTGEKFTYHGVSARTVSVCEMIRAMYVDAVQDRKYIEGKINAFKDAESNK